MMCALDMCVCVWCFVLARIQCACGNCNDKTRQRSGGPSTTATSQVMSGDQSHEMKSGTSEGHLIAFLNSEKAIMIAAQAPRWLNEQLGRTDTVQRPSMIPPARPSDQQRRRLNVDQGKLEEEERTLA